MSHHRLVLAFATACLALANAQITDGFGHTARHVDTVNGAGFHGNQTLAAMFDKAIEAYLDENWDECIDRFHELLDGYRQYRRMVTGCRDICRAEAADTSFMFPENIEDLHFYEKKVRETLCLMKCNKEYKHFVNPKTLNILTPEVEKKFLEFRAYEYLHICYYQKNENQAAASAIFTFLVQHPNHEISVQTLKFYLSLPDVSEEKVVNLEAPPFLASYMDGVASYEKQHFQEATLLLERSLKSYLEFEEECRRYCEGPFDQGWFPEFTSSVANHFAYCLKCKHDCSRTLRNVNGVYRPDLLRSHYDYLQFAYYKLGNTKAACEAVESYLVFQPADETMLSNKEFYRRLPKANDDYFVPRQEVIAYVKRYEYELKLLRYILDEFSAVETKFRKGKKVKETEKQQSTNEEDLTTKNFLTNPLHTPPVHSLSSQIRVRGNLSVIADTERGGTTLKDNLDAIHFNVSNHVRPLARRGELGGKYRYVANGFLNRADCESLMKLARVSVVEGDGYKAHKSPHSNYELFEGATVGRLALMVYYGMLAPEFLEIFLQRTEEVKQHVEMYFNLDRHLHFTYTHLVCRTALPGNFHLTHLRASGSLNTIITIRQLTEPT